MRAVVEDGGTSRPVEWPPIGAIMKNPAASALMAALAAVLAAPGAAAAGVVSDWNARAGTAARTACIAPANNPLHEARMYAITHLAMHDALNAIERRSRPYAFDAIAPSDASPEAAVAAAARDALVALLSEIGFPFPPQCADDGIAYVEAEYAAALGGIPDGPAKDAGLLAGQAAAAAILLRRAGDNAGTTLLDFAYPQGTAPGEYRFTPGQTFAFAPRWGEVTPFVLQTASQYSASKPYRIDSPQYTADYEEVRLYGSLTGSLRTADQTEIAHFWVESSPLLWNRVARGVADSEGLDDWEQARLFGLLNMALADGYVATFENKYRYNFWRPVTAIQLGDDDGNPETAGNPDWEPLVPTPPIPDHDSGHAVQGGAAATVLALVLGSDAIPFSTCSLTLPADTCDDPSPKLRHFSSFSAAAAENAVSRILVGFHFRHAVEAGAEHGRKIGQRAVNLYLKQQ
jgi:hypothetical protein